VAALVALLSGSTRAAEPGDEFKRAGNVHEIAADGSVVAFAGSGRPGCSHLGKSTRASTYDLMTGRTVEFRGCAWGPVTSLAVAGDRVAWLSISPSLSSAYVDLFTSRIGSSATRHVIAAESSADGLDGLSKGGPGDEDVGLLAGRGQTLAFLSWKYREGGALRDERVWRLGPKGGKVLLARVRDVRALAVDEELVAALEGDGRVVFLRHAGGVARIVQLRGGLDGDLHPLPRKDRDLAFRGGLVAVLAARALAVYDADTGEMRASFPLPAVRLASRGLLDLEAGLVSYLLGNQIHVLRISDGAEVVVAHTRLQPARCGDGDVWAQLEPAGLIYSASRTTTCTASRIGVVSMDELLALFPS
jgi:hypothetical protein